MDKIYSKIDPTKLLHIIYRRKDFSHGRVDVVPADQFIQMAALSLPARKTFKPHKHILKDPFPYSVRAQESWVVITGMVKAILYDLDDHPIAFPLLFPGDCSITLIGGHNYEIMADNTLVYEFKTGPYRGQEKDKVFIE